MTVQCGDGGGGGNARLIYASDAILAVRIQSTTTYTSIPPCFRSLQSQFV